MNDFHIPSVMIESDVSPSASAESDNPEEVSAVAGDVVLEAMPSIMRIESLTRTLVRDSIHNRATLHHRQASMCVDWVTQHVDSRLHAGGLVSSVLQPKHDVRMAQSESSVC